MSSRLPPPTRRQPRKRRANPLQICAVWVRKVWFGDCSTVVTAAHLARGPWRRDAGGAGWCGRSPAAANPPAAKATFTPSALMHPLFTWKFGVVSRNGEGGVDAALQPRVALAGGTRGRGCLCGSPVLRDAHVTLQARQSRDTPHTPHHPRTGRWSHEPEKFIYGDSRKFVVYPLSE